MWIVHHKNGYLIGNKNGLIDFAKIFEQGGASVA